MRLSLCVTPLLALALAGCPKPRTSAATQPTPAAFDATKSDPNAIKVVDEGIAKLGGADKWTTLKQLQFSIDYKQDDKVKAHYDHAWDRWNGRHHYWATDMSTVGGKPDDVKQAEARYDLYDTDSMPWMAYGGSEQPRSQASDFAKKATTQLWEDLYFLAIVYKMKDPGVILKVDNAEVMVQDSESCKPSCTSVKVTFDPAVGHDTWYVSFNNDTKMPQVIEMQKGAGRIGYEIQGWSDSGGLKWPVKLQNLGFKAEVIEFSDVKAGDVDEELYVPNVAHSGGG